MKRVLTGLVLACGVALHSIAQNSQTAFSYQGRLTSAGVLYSGSADLQVSVYDAETGGTLVGGPLLISNVPVVSGVYSTMLDFGAAFGGGVRWLEVSVRTPSGSGSFTTLAPREVVGAAPVAASLVGMSPTSGVDISQTFASGLIGSAPPSNIVQTFKPKVTGKLLSLKLKYSVSSPAALQLAVTDAFGNAIAGGNATANVSAPGNYEVNFSFLTPPALQAGTTYQLKAPAGNGVGFPALWFEPSNVYPDGTLNGSPNADAYFVTTMDGIGRNFDLPASFSQSVGIGTKTPEVALQVAPTSGIAIGQGPTIGGYTALTMDLSAVSGGIARIQAIQSSGSAYGLLQLNPFGGNVAVGSPDGSYRLDIQSPGSANALRVSSGSTATVFSMANTGTSGRNYTLASNGNGLGSFVLRDATGGVDRLTVYSNGRMGMGSTTNPGGLLDVTANGTSTVAIIGRAGAGSSAVGIYGTASGPGPKAGQFDGAVTINGNLTVNGSVSKTSGSFRIPHPLDPERKWLFHSFVESPDMMNVYNGMIVLDEKGEATVELPDYFQSLNSNYRYQLTAVGASMPGLYVAKEIEKNRFAISGGKPGAKVSWQVTGIRQDEAAKKERIVPEVERTAMDP